MDIGTIQRLKQHGIKGMPQLEILAFIALPTTLQEISSGTGMHTGRVWSALRGMRQMIRSLSERNGARPDEVLYRYMQSETAVRVLSGIVLELVRELRQLGVQAFAQLSILAVTDIPLFKREIAARSGLKEGTVSQTVYTMQDLLEVTPAPLRNPGAGMGRPRKLLVRTEAVSRLLGGRKP